MCITEDYVSFETAKLLYEKGFDLHFYSDWYVDYDNSDWVDDVSEEDEENGSIIINQYHYPLITHQMASKFIRKVYNIHIEPILCTKDKKIVYLLRYVNLTNLDWGCAANEFDISNPPCEEKYEEAVEATIKYCLENLI